jgi:hypothetical protein
MPSLQDLSLSELCAQADDQLVKRLERPLTWRNNVHNNDLQQAIIAAMHREHGAAWLGNVVLNGRTRGFPVLVPWTGEAVRPYSVSFVVPRCDLGLAMLITALDTGRFKEEDWLESMMRITNRVSEIGGCCLHWA